MNKPVAPPTEFQANAEAPAAHSPDLAVSFDEFEAAYDRWKAATVVFEEAVRSMRRGDPAAREQAQDCARELARLHHAFLEASQPHFAASADHAEDEPRSNPRARSSANAPMAPGDEAPAGTPGTGLTVCRDCGGSGRIGPAVCATCSGTGQINAAIGGA